MWRIPNGAVELLIGLAILHFIGQIFLPQFTGYIKQRQGLLSVLQRSEGYELW